LLALVLVFGLQPAALAQPLPDDWAKTWADATIAKGVADGRATAAVVTIVQGGKVVLSAGYGVADGPGGRPVDPVRDRFQIASVSKTFTGALLAQLTGEGLIASLSDPAQTYIRRVKLPERNGRKPTLAQLASHSAGFEERGFGYFAHEAVRIPADPAYISRAMPALVRDPGEKSVYANIDPAIVGVALEDITGKPLRELMAERLFRPLGMTSTELSYAEAGSPDLVQAYQGATRISPVHNAPFFAPTGSVETTGKDMGAWLLAMLGHRSDVLPTEQLALLASPLARNHPALDGIGVYWMLTRWGEVSVLEHAGGLRGVGAWVILIPGRDVGVFVAWAGGAPSFDYGAIHDSFLQAAAGPLPPAVWTPSSDLAALAGRYWDERRPHVTAEVLFALDGVQTVRVEDQAIWIGARGPFRPIGENVFRLDAPAGRLGETIAFEDGRLLQRTSYSKRVSGWDDPGVQSTAFNLAIGLCLTGVLAVFWPLPRGRLAAIGGAGCAAIVLGALYLGGGIGAFIEEMQAGSSLRFVLIAGASLGMGLCCAFLSWSLMRQLQAMPGRSLRIGVGLVHACSVAFALIVAFAILLGWRVLELPRL
jgi:CubicO group peptidase (beta-lactamase class C family)